MTPAWRRLGEKDAYVNAVRSVFPEDFSAVYQEDAPPACKSLTDRGCHEIARRIGWRRLLHMSRKWRTDWNNAYPDCGWTSRALRRSLLVRAVIRGAVTS